MYPGSASITLLFIICQKYTRLHSLEHSHRSGKWNSALTLSVHRLFVWKNAMETAQNLDPRKLPHCPRWEEPSAGRLMTLLLP